MQQSGMWEVKVSDYVLFSECLELPSCVCLFCLSKFGTELWRATASLFWHLVCLTLSSFGMPSVFHREKGRALHEQLLLARRWRFDFHGMLKAHLFVPKICLDAPSRCPKIPLNSCESLVPQPPLQLQDCIGHSANCPQKREKTLTNMKNHQ